MNKKTFGIAFLVILAGVLAYFGYEYFSQPEYIDDTSWELDGGE